MKNGLLYVFLLLFVATSSQNAFSQRGGGGHGAIPRVTLHPTITHATCFDPTGTISYYIEVANGWGKGTKVNRLDLFDENWTIVQPLTNNSCCGTVTGLSPGMYTFFGSMTVITSIGMYVSVPINHTVWLGIETVWVEKIDMIASPNSFSAKRNAATVDYGGVRSSNGISSGNGWIEMSAVYGTTNDNRVFLMIGETDPLGLFDPNGDIQYVEFFKGSSGNGIRIKSEDVGGNFVYTTLSSNYNDKIRLVRNGATLTIQKNNSNATIFVLPVTYAGPMNIAVRTLAEEDGGLNVLSTFDCTPIESNLYGHLKYKLDGFYHIMKNGHIKFVFDQEYDADNLVFNIYNQNDQLIRTEADFPPILTTNGDNYLLIDVSQASNCLQRGFYYLEVINSKKEKSYLRFLNDFANPDCLGEIDPNGSNN